MMLPARRLALALAGSALLMSLGGCGDDVAAIDNGTTVSAEGAAEIERFAAAQRASGRVTEIDAATADASGMPDAQTGPDAYALEQRAAAREQREAPAGDGNVAEAPMPRIPAVEEVLPSVAD